MKRRGGGVAIRASAHSSSQSVLVQVAEMLDDEAEADASLRARYGVRWALAPSSDAAASLHQERLSAMKVRLLRTTC